MGRRTSVIYDVDCVGQERRRLKHAFPPIPLIRTELTARWWPRAASRLQAARSHDSVDTELGRCLRIRIAHRPTPSHTGHGGRGEGGRTLDRRLLSSPRRITCQIQKSWRPRSANHPAVFAAYFWLPGRVTAPASLLPLKTPQALTCQCGVHLECNDSTSPAIGSERQRAATRRPRSSRRKTSQDRLHAKINYCYDCGTQDREAH